MSYRRVIINTNLEKINTPIKTVQIRNQTIVDGPKNAFLNLIHTGYMRHLGIKITPDDLWLVILCNLARHVNDKSDYYKEYLADKDNLDGNTSIIIETETLDLNNTEFMNSIFEELIVQINAKTKSNILGKLVCDFSTSTPITILTSQVSTAYMVEKFFSMRMSVSCGIPYIDVMGEIEDWVKINKKLDIFNKIAHNDIKIYIAKCTSVVNNFIKLNVFNYDTKFWEKFYYQERCGSGSIEYSGWILGCINKEIDSYWTPYDEDPTRIKYEFNIIDNSNKDINDTSTDIPITIDIGPVGPVYKVYEDSNSDSSWVGLELKYDYFFDKTKPIGWRLDNVAIEYNKIDWTTKNIYDRITYCGKKIHELIEEFENSNDPSFNDLISDFSIQDYKSVKKLLIYCDMDSFNRGINLLSYDPNCNRFGVNGNYYNCNISFRDGKASFTSVGIRMGDEYSDLLDSNSNNTVTNTLTNANKTESDSSILSFITNLFTKTNKKTNKRTSIKYHNRILLHDFRNV
jgi:hypothetical protein